MEAKKLGRFDSTGEVVTGDYGYPILGFEKCIKVGCKKLSFSKARKTIALIRKLKAKKETICMVCLIEHGVIRAKEHNLGWTVYPNERLLKRIEKFMAKMEQGGMR